MKNYIVLFAAVLAYAVAPAQNKSISKIKKVLDMQAEAWNSGNIEQYMEGYLQSDSLVFIGKSGITRGWKATLENYKKSYPDKAAMGFLTFDNLSYTKLGRKYYFVTGRWHLKRINDELSGHFSLVWKKIKGRWFIIADHSS